MIQCSFSVLLLIFPRSNAIDFVRLVRLVRSSNAPASMVTYRHHRMLPKLTALDAVPKKRGPKTDVLEALLKRVDGLEKRLKDEKKSDSTNDGNTAEEHIVGDDSKPQIPKLDTSIVPDETAVYSPTPIRCQLPFVPQE
jgi:hypothetical protein